MLVNWSTIKQFANDRAIASLQYVNQNGRYVISAIDSNFRLDCVLPITTPPSADQADFETNYMASANVTPKSEVVTQFELNNKTLKAVSDAQPCDPTTGVATISFVVPGEFNGIDEGCNGRYVDWGQAWFNPQSPADRILGINIIDTIGVLGFGPGVPIRTYHDTETPEDQQGVRIPFKYGHAEVEPIGGYGFLPATFTLQIVGKCGAPGPGVNLFVNVFWGIQDGPT